MRIDHGIDIILEDEDPVLITDHGQGNDDRVSLHGYGGPGWTTWCIRFLACPSHIQALRHVLDALEKKIQVDDAPTT